jgi:hypothetical protein
MLRFLIVTNIGTILGVVALMSLSIADTFFHVDGLSNAFDIAGAATIGLLTVSCSIVIIKFSVSGKR